MNMRGTLPSCSHRAAPLLCAPLPSARGSARPGLSEQTTPRCHAACTSSRVVLCGAVAGKVATIAKPEEAPQPEEVVIDQVSTHEVVPGVHLIRGACSSRLKYEVEYNLRRGTTDNCYVLRAPGATVLIDVPFEAFASLYMSAVKKLTPLSEVTHVVLTQLDPKSIPCLEALLEAVRREAGPKAQVKLVLSNPAARLLQSALGEKPEKAALLSSAQLVVARSGLMVPVGSGGQELELVLLPTPRWPDLLLVYDASHRMMFTSKLFAAHVSPTVAEANEEAKGSVASALDVGGWDAYGSDWRHFFECMLAPQARQALPALERLDLVPVPAGSSATARSQRLQNKDLTFGLELGQWLYRLLTGKKNVNPLSGKPTVVVDAPSSASSSAPPEEYATSASSASRPVTYLLPMHGPVVSNAVAQLVREYRVWTEAQVAAASLSCAVVLYASAYGNTATLAQAISRGITKAGVAVDMFNLETASLDEVTAAVSAGNGFIIGSPTLGGHMPTQVQVALGSVVRETQAKLMPCGVFGSFGWSGEAVDEMEQKLKDAGFSFAFSPIRVKFRPTAKDLQVCEESGRELAMAIKRKLKAREASVAAGCAKQALASAPMLAMGRVVGSLSVLTAKDEDASSAMLASWVSQASFDPPGITVAVKKDRAMEPLLVVGGKFAMSIIPEGKDKLVMKRLARPFQPGEDRLQGLETFPGEVTGAPILKAANASLECQVVSRMETGDHWLVYASVAAGKLLDDTAPTAVHHRKVGNHY